LPARVLTDTEHRKSLGWRRGSEEPLVAKRPAKCDVNVESHIGIDVLDVPIGQDWPRNGVASTVRHLQS
jgi:hypothetical protein